MKPLEKRELGADLPRPCKPVTKVLPNNHVHKSPDSNPGKRFAVDKDKANFGLMLEENKDGRD